MKKRKLYPKGYAQYNNHDDWTPIEWSSLVRINGKKRPIDAYMRRRILNKIGGQEYDADTKRRRNMMKTLRNKHANTLKYGLQDGPIVTIHEREKERYRARKWYKKAKLASKSKKI